MAEAAGAGRLRSDRGVSSVSLPWIACGIRPAGCDSAYGRERCAGARSCRSTCTVGFGGSDAWNNSPDCSPRSSPVSATSCWASSNWFTARASRRGRGPSVKRRFAASPSTLRNATSTSRRPVRTIAPGGARRGLWGGSRRPRRGVSRRGRQCLGAISRALEWDASIHVRSRRTVARGDRRSPRRAFRGYVAIGSRLTLASTARLGPTRRASRRCCRRWKMAQLPLRISGAD